MRTYPSEDKQVTKHVHDDGSETCIKTVPSLDTKPNDQGEVELAVVDRNKYSIFVSDSKGCPLNCQFCYLTIDEVPFQKLTYVDLTRNIMDAVHHRVESEPEIVNRYVKLCWMGMGEPILKTPAPKTITFLLLEENVMSSSFPP